MLASFANLTAGGNVATCTAGVKWWRACVVAIGDKNFQMGGSVACVPLKKNWTPSPRLRSRCFACERVCVRVLVLARCRGAKKEGTPKDSPLI